jgi:hypothetical protein
MVLSATPSANTHASSFSRTQAPPTDFSLRLPPDTSSPCSYTQSGKPTLAALAATAGPPLPAFPAANQPAIEGHRGRQWSQLSSGTLGERGPLTRVDSRE